MEKKEESQNHWQDTESEEQGLPPRKFWRQPASNSRIEWVEKRSRFLAFARRIEGEADATDFLQILRREYPDAHHHVYAWQTFTPDQRGGFSDDGEPSGTAGRPVFDLLRKNEIDQGALYVVRYFGGILLGSGGLVRAYRGAAAMALQEAGIERMILQRRCRISCSYRDAEKFQYQLSQAGVLLENAEYGADVAYLVAFPPEREEEITALCASLSCGTARLEKLELLYLPEA